MAGMMPDARLSTSFSSALLLLTMSSMLPSTNAKEAVKIMLNDFKISNTTDHLSLVLAHPNSTVDIGLHHQESTANVSSTRVSTTGSWSEWSECSRSCKQQRTRVCRRFERCNRRERRPCLTPTGPCSVEKLPDKGLKDVLYDLLYYDWTEWSECLVRSCKRKRYRTCAVKTWCHNTVLLEEKRCHINGTEKCSKVAKPSPTVPVVDNNCGRQAPTPSLRIVGGQETRRGRWPWVVAIMTRFKEQYCGGVLIAPQWVLTAAHCIRKKGKRRKLVIRIGDHNLSNSEGSERNVRLLSDFVHQDFDINTIDSDIALIKLKRPVTVDRYVNIACLPQPRDLLPPNTLCYAIGWGKMKDSHAFGTDVLREARVPLLEDNVCRQAFEYDITQNQMCAGYTRGGVDTCAGDSGGPLMCEIEKNGVRRWYVYGVTSFGEGCGDRGKYGIYTRVTNFSNWIRETMKKNQ